jgi:hypothetical protein
MRSLRRLPANRAAQQIKAPVPAGSGTVLKLKLSLPGYVEVVSYSSRNWSPAGREKYAGRNVVVLANSVCEVVVSVREIFESGPNKVADSDVNSALPVTLKAEFTETNTFPSERPLDCVAEADPVIVKADPVIAEADPVIDKPSLVATVRA